MDLPEPSLRQHYYYYYCLCFWICDNSAQTETDMAETGVNILLNWRPYDDAFIVDYIVE